MYTPVNSSVRGLTLHGHVSIMIIYINMLKLTQTFNDLFNDLSRACNILFKAPRELGIEENKMYTPVNSRFLYKSGV